MRKIIGTGGVREMTDRLDLLVERLGAAPTDRSLDQLEADVVRGVRRFRGRASESTTLGPVRFASVGLALVIGVTAGGLTALTATAAPSRSDGLSEGMRLAPSSLLDSSQ